jgi:hypothetical protein
MWDEPPQTKNGHTVLRPVIQGNVIGARSV